MSFSTLGEYPDIETLGVFVSVVGQIRGFWPEFRREGYKIWVFFVGGTKNGGRSERDTKFVFSLVLMFQWFTHSSLSPQNTS